MTDIDARPNVLIAGQYWCKCGNWTADSKYSLCPPCEDKRRRPRYPLSRYLFEGLV